MRRPVEVPANARGKLKPGGYTIWYAGSGRLILRDAYHSFLQMRWSASLGLIALAFFLVNLVFAVIYDRLGGVAGARAGSFFDAFIFSVETLATIGYGVMNPKSGPANTVMMVQAVTGIIFMALATGLVFTKFARTTAKVRFTTNCVITQSDGKPTLIFRVGNHSSFAVVEPHLNVTATFTRLTADGQRSYRAYKLEFEHNPIAGTRGWTVMHVIGEHSPFFGLDAEGIAKAEVEIEISLTGIDEVTMGTVHTIHQYLDSQIKFGYRFTEPHRMLPNGDMMVDLRQLDVIVPDTQLRDRVAQ